MTIPSLSVRGLRKRYGGGPPALRDVSLTAYPGDIMGILGPNGAGKTTTLRVIAGLILDFEGSIEMLGRPRRPMEAPNPGLVNGLVDEPGFLPYLTGRENLSLLLQLGGLPSYNLAQTIRRAGVDRFIDVRYSTYSHGMRQRLGIAAALLTDAPIVLWDEPFDGLDPAAQVEMRQVLLGLASEGKTVLVSSHRLSEIERVCSRIAMVKAGQTLVEGSIEDLMGGERLVARVNDAQKACHALVASGFRAAVDGDNAVVVELGQTTDSKLIFRTLAAADIDIHELSRQADTLERVYMELFAEKQDGSP